MAPPAEALQPPTPPVETDAVVIGAGPVGLFQVFQLGLLEMKAHVIDSLPQPGGQCVELYADKPIYDIPAVPVCTGRELTGRLLQQIAPFAATFHLGQEVTALQRRPDGRFLLDTSRGTRLLARVVMIAAGVGSFQPRTLKVDGIDRFAAQPDPQLLYHVDDPSRLAGRHVVIVGGGDSALDAALQFAEGDAAHRAASVVLVHRRDVFQAAATTTARFRAACAAGRLQFIVGQVTGFTEDHGRLRQVRVAGPDEVTRLLLLDSLLVFHGLSPRLGPVAGWGLAIERKQLVVDTARFETSEPGIFAVGDINTYPGKRKLIVCGFHEATLAAYAAASQVFPGRPVLLQYTTTSPRLHALLGVESPPLD